MDDRMRVWFLAYVTVLGIRYHPRSEDTAEKCRRMALEAADAAVEDYFERWAPGST